MKELWRLGVMTPLVVCHDTSMIWMHIAINYCISLVVFVYIFI